MKSIDVSFIVTIYNKEKYIPEMIQGLLEQKGNFTREYIFVNDGSTDNSLFLLRKLTKLWPNVVIIHQTNQGVCSALNTGIQRARGQYLKFVDGDDRLDPTATDTLLQALTQHPTAVASFGKAKAGKPQDSDDMNLKPSFCLIQKPFIPLLNGQYHQINSMGASPSLILRQAVLNVGLTDERVKIQDFPLALRLAYRYSFVYVDSVVCWCPESMDNRLSNNKKTEVYQTLSTLKLFLAEYSLSGKEVGYCVKKAVRGIVKQGYSSNLAVVDKIKLFVIKKGGWRFMTNQEKAITMINKFSDEFYCT